MTTGDKAWSADCQDRDQSLLLTESCVVSGRECWEVANGKCTLLAPGRARGGGGAGTDQVLIAAQAVCGWPGCPTAARAEPARERGPGPGGRRDLRRQPGCYGRQRSDGPGLGAAHRRVPGRADGPQDTSPPGW